MEGMKREKRKVKKCVYYLVSMWDKSLTRDLDHK